MKRNVRILFTRVLPIVLIAVFSLLILFHVLGIRSRENEWIDATLIAALQEQKDRFTERIEGDLSTLQVFSDSITTPDERSAPETLRRMHRMIESTDFEQLFILDQTGRITAQTVEEPLAFTSEISDQTLIGVTAIRFDDASGSENGNATLLLFVPVRQNERFVGALVGALDDAVLRDLLNSSTLELNGTVLCDSTGQVLAGETGFLTESSAKNLFTQLETAAATPSKTVESITSTIQRGATGSVDLIDEQDCWHIAYSSLDWNGWFLCLSSTATLVSSIPHANDNGRYGLLIVAMISALLLVLIVVLLYRNAIRTSRKERKRLINAEEEYRISARQGGIMVARFDVESGVLLSSQGAVEHLQIPLDTADFHSYHMFEPLVAAESEQDFQAFWDSIRQGRSNGQTEIGMKSIEGTLRWYTFEFSAIGDGGGTNMQAIVTIRDVTNLHERMAAYKRWQNVMLSSVGKYAALMEINLSTGVYERVEGEFLEYAEPENGECRAETLLGQFGLRAVEQSDRERFLTFSSLGRLREIAEKGVQKDEIEILLSKEAEKPRLCQFSAQMASFPKTGEIKAFITIKDLEDFRFEMERLSNLALYDELSGLLNRTAARNAIEDALRYGAAERVALFMIDADNFKQVNDTLGHQHGDLALIQISQAIKSVFRASDIVARIGGDEFFVFLSEVPGEEFAESKATALCSALRTTYSVEEHGFVALTASIGVVVARRDRVDYETLYSEADRALYDAKNAGKDRYSIRIPERMETSKTHRPRVAGSILQMESLMKHLDGGVLLLEVGERIEPLFVSEGYFQLRGIMAEAITKGTFPEAVIHPNDFAQLSAAVYACANDGESFQISYRNVLADGGYGWRHMNATRVPSMRENKPVVLAVISDITELHNVTERLEKLAAHSQIGIFIMRVGERLEVTFFNDDVLAITGFTYEQMRLFSRDASAFFRWGNLELFREEVRAATAENRMVNFLYESRGFDGKHAHNTRLYGVKLDIQNGVPSYLILLIDNDDSVSVTPPAAV